MAKKSVKKPKVKSTKKTTVSKTTVKAATKTKTKSVVKKTKPAVKKSAKTKAGTKTKVKKVITDKERDVRAANAIANSEKKKTKRTSAIKTKGAVSVKTKRPVKTHTEEQASALLNAIVEGMQEKKAKNIAVLNLSNIESRVSDFFVICDADSRTHVTAIADSVEEMVHKLTAEKAYHAEGHSNGEWILIDYINVVAHVFLKEIRDHYNIEGLWGDADVTLIND